jgi:hypothetical protein
MEVLPRRRGGGLGEKGIWGRGEEGIRGIVHDGDAFESLRHRGGAEGD